jgi:hypothetical protein
MCLRTDDSVLIDALTEVEGRPLLTAGAIMKDVLRAQPHRVDVVPGRPYRDVPADPSAGWQVAVPTAYPSASLTARQEPRAFGEHAIASGITGGVDGAPQVCVARWTGVRLALRVWEQYGLLEDRTVRERISVQVMRNPSSPTTDWPETRRGRACARITLRRLSAGEKNEPPPGACNGIVRASSPKRMKH